MSKLAAQDKFLDLSDYGRPLAISAKIKKPDSHPFMSHFFWSFGNSYLLYLTKPVLAGFHHFKINY
jgi:hypothetical protein